MLLYRVQTLPRRYCIGYRCYWDVTVYGTDVTEALLYRVQTLLHRVQTLLRRYCIEYRRYWGVTYIVYRYWSVNGKEYIRYCGVTEYSADVTEVEQELVKYGYNRQQSSYIKGLRVTNQCFYHLYSVTDACNGNYSWLWWSHSINTLITAGTD